MVKKIKWQKYRYPLKPGDNIYNEDKDGGSYCPKCDTLNQGGMLPMRPVLLTNMGGLLPLYNIEDDIIEFWIGHTNFYVTTNIANVIMAVEGIESFEVVSPYRFRIGVAKLFQSRTVMNQIAAQVSIANTTKDDIQGIDRALDDLSRM